MARLQRLTLSGQPHHVIQRGNNREPVFFADEDYRFYLALLREHADLFQCQIHAYVLMTNHVHLLVTPNSESGLSRLMQFVGRRYVRYINKTYQRTGTLWEGRFKSSLIESEGYLLTCMRYIELNPVRAKMVRKPGKYAWSSYRVNVDGDYSGLVIPHKIYRALAVTPAQQRHAYGKLFEDAIPQDDLDLLRQSIKGGWAVGSNKFKNKIAKALSSRVSPLPRGGLRLPQKNTR
jgi:putative transposase